MAATLTLDDVRRAWDTRDPELPRLIAQLAEQPDPEPDKPVREGAPTFDQFLYETSSPRSSARSRRTSRPTSASSR